MSLPLSIVPQLRAAGVDCMTRAEWGSPRQADGSYRKRRDTHPMPPGPASFHFLHITVTGDTDTRAEGAAGARQIESFGLSTPPMVSYQDLVTNEGRYFQGQNYTVKGTHTVNDRNVPGFPDDLNRHGYAVAIMQNVGDAVTDVQVEVVAKVLAARELAGLVVKGAPVYPHRKFAFKACPGDRAVARLDEIVRLKNQYVRAGRLPGTEVKEWDDMATKAEIVEAVAEVVESKLADQKVNMRGPDGKIQEWNDDTVSRLVVSRLNRILERLDTLEGKLDELEGAK